MGSIPKLKKNIPKSVNEMSKEMLQETLKKKKECNAKAQQTVEKLCEENVDEEWFLENLQFINQCHFDDAAVERAITKICGYPLCDKKLDKIPAQQYRISTRYNKVFDISERKNFCSNCCYKSAMYIKKQLFTSPLWFRDQEVIPKYKVLKSEKSSLGEEIVFFSDKIKQEQDNLEKKTSSSDKVNELSERYSNITIDDSKKVPVELTKKTVTENSFDNENIKKVPAELTKTTVTENSFDNENIKKIGAVEKEVKKMDDNFNISKKFSAIIIPNVPEKTLTDIKPDIIKTEIKTNINVVNVNVNAVSKVEKCVFEWFTLDTLFYLYTEEKLKELFENKAIRIKEILNSKLAMMRCNENIDRMIRLYGLLDSSVFGGNETKTNLKPLPDYSVLKKEGKTLEVKVRAFYQGQLEIKPPEKEETNEEEETKTDSSPIYLPLIDAHAQSALRRKIMLDKLNRVLPEVIHVFSTDYVLQMSEIRNLVTTFMLTASNITFRPREWYLVGVIMIKLMCLKDKQLEKMFESSKSQLSLILTSYELQEDYLDNLIQRLTDGAKLVEKINDK